MLSKVSCYLQLSTVHAIYLQYLLQSMSCRRYVRDISHFNNMIFKNTVTPRQQRLCHSTTWLHMLQRGWGTNTPFCVYHSASLCRRAGSDLVTQQPNTDGWGAVVTKDAIFEQNENRYQTDTKAYRTWKPRTKPIFIELIIPFHYFSRFIDDYAYFTYFIRYVGEYTKLA